MDKKPEFLWQVYTATNTWVSFADAKAMGLLAAGGVIGGMVFSNIDSIITKVLPNAWAIRFACASGVALIGSFIFALNCVLPRLSLIPPKILIRLGVHPKTIHPEAISSLYFNHIADMSEADYLTRVNEMLRTEQNAIKQIAQQIWMNSRVAVRKYRDVKWSIWLLAFAIAFGIISLFLTYVR